jgi:hypothetical protein
MLIVSFFPICASSPFPWCGVVSVQDPQPNALQTPNFRVVGVTLAALVAEMILQCLALALLTGQVWSQSIDLRTHARVAHAWMETGFVSVNDANW